MQIVIDIPEDEYLMMRMADQFTVNKYGMGSYAIYCILNGTPLPKGHGRLGDLDSLYQKVQNEESDTDDEKSMKALFRYLIR